MPPDEVRKVLIFATTTHAPEGTRGLSVSKPHCRARPTGQAPHSTKDEAVAGPGGVSPEATRVRRQPSLPRSSPDPDPRSVRRAASLESSAGRTPIDPFGVDLWPRGRVTSATHPSQPHPSRSLSRTRAFAYLSSWKTLFVVNPRGEIPTIRLERVVGLIRKHGVLLSL